MLKGRHRKCGKPCCASAVRASSTRRGACCSRARWAGSGTGPCGPACCAPGAGGYSPLPAWPSGCSRNCASCPASDCSTGRRPSSSRRCRANRPPSRRVSSVCGIVGYVGTRQAAPILVDGLRRLEYRGYDSAGVAVQNGAGIVVTKLAGRVHALQDRLEQAPIVGTSGIAHTRWATHGAPTQRNAHPHTDCGGRLALVHNGIIENADALRAALERDGHRFRTETDTETLAHLIEDAPGATLEERVIAALGHVEGTYGLAVMSADEPEKIVVARQGSPVLLGIGADECFVASDASAVLEHTRSVVYLDDGDIAVLTPDGYHVVDAESHVQLREVDDVAWDLAEIELGGYPHFMLKEISEQAETVRATLRGPRRGIARGGDRQRGGEHDRARGGWGHLPACRPRDRRGVDQGLHLPDRGAGAAGALSGTRAGPERGAGSRAGGPAHPAASARDRRARARATGPEPGGAVRAGVQRAVPWPRGELPGGTRGRPEAQGDQLHPRRGLSRGGDEARADRPHRRAHAGGVRRAQGRGVRQGAVQHAGGEGASRPRSEERRVGKE